MQRHSEGSSEPLPSLQQIFVTDMSLDTLAPTSSLPFQFQSGIDSPYLFTQHMLAECLLRADTSSSVLWAAAVNTEDKCHFCPHCVEPQ